MFSLIAKDYSFMLSFSRSDSPIFVVGAPRSGTTLLAAIFSAHKRLHCGSETHFFHYLAQTNVEDLLKKETWPAVAVDFLFSMKHGPMGQSVPVNYGFTYQQLSENLSQYQPSIPAMLHAVIGKNASSYGKERSVEKTPRHILHLPVIRKYFPHSPIIRIIRDPRDMALSLIKAPWNWAPRDFAGAMLMWKHIYDFSDTFFQHDDLCISVRYEDILMSPEREMERLCAFIGEEYESGMLDTSTSYKNVNSLGEPWKEKVQKGLDSSRVEVWKRELNSDLERLSDCLLGNYIRKFSYPIYENNMQYGTIVPFDALLKYKDSLELITGEGIRIWPIGKRERAKISIFLGDPECDQWIGAIMRQRLLMLIRVIFTVIGALAGTKKIFWIVSKSKRKGLINSLISGLLKQVAFIREATNESENTLQWRKNIHCNPRLQANDIKTSPPHLAG